MLRRLFCKRFPVMVLVVILVVMLISSPALAASIDDYVIRYLHVTEPIGLEIKWTG
jgi:hypothetical protein